MFIALEFIGTIRLRLEGAEGILRDRTLVGVREECVQQVSPELACHKDLQQNADENARIVFPARAHCQEIRISPMT